MKTIKTLVAAAMALAFFTSGSVMAKGAGKEHAAEKPVREKPAAEKPVGEKSKVGVERPEFLAPLRPVAREWR